MADGSGAIAVKRRVMVSGDQLTDAKQSFDQDGRPDIDITFNTAGARRFGRVTQENVGKPFAIILDDKVLSAPNINEPILGGRAQISGSFTVQSAHDLAVSLASGKLPVKLNVIEERTIGPDLGKDSIHKGVIASLIGTLGGHHLHAGHLRPVRRLCEHRAGRERVPDPRHHGDVQRDADAAGHRRLHPDDRRRGRRQRADQRAHPRGNPARAAAASTPSRPAITRRSGRFSTPTSRTSSRRRSWPISAPARCAASRSCC